MFIDDRINSNLQEDDIVELLKFDRKQLRAIMAILKNDKLVKTKIRLETSSDGKSQRHNYYFINYQVRTYDWWGFFVLIMIIYKFIKCMLTWPLYNL